MSTQKYTTREPATNCGSTSNSNNNINSSNTNNRRIGAKGCTPEIGTSEIILDLQWYVPMDCHFSSGFPKDCHWKRIATFPLDFPKDFQRISKGLPKDFHGIFPKDCHFSSGFPTGNFQWTFTGTFQ